MKKTIKKIERKSSLESEPRTLSLDQIQYARDAALYVVKNKSFEDAIRIFTEGLKPIMNKRQKMDEASDRDHNATAGAVEEGEELEEGGEGNNCFGAHIKLPTVVIKGLRDVVSSPF